MVPLRSAALKLRPKKTRWIGRPCYDWWVDEWGFLYVNLGWIDMNRQVMNPGLIYNDFLAKCGVNVDDGLALCAEGLCPYHRIPYLMDSSNCCSISGASETSLHHCITFWHSTAGCTCSNHPFWLIITRLNKDWIKHSFVWKYGQLREKSSCWSSFYHILPLNISCLEDPCSGTVSGHGFHQGMGSWRRFSVFWSRRMRARTCPNDETMVWYPIVYPIIYNPKNDFFPSWKYFSILIWVIYIYI